MFGTKLVAIAAAVGVCLAAPAVAFAQNDWSGYASVDGLEMYYEIHGTGQLAVLPGTTHVSLVDRADWLTSMITAFLDALMHRAD